MGAAPLRLSFERALSAAVAASTFAFVCASASIVEIVSVARPARWVLLVCLLGLAAAGARGRRSLRIAVWPLVPLTLFLELVLVSAAWSVSPRLTIGRGLSLVLLAVVSLALAACCADRPDRVRAVLAGVVAGAAATALAGLVVLAIDRGRAVIPASVQYPSRYQGLGANPNTMPMLLSLALGAAAALLPGSRDIRTRLLVGGCVALFAGSIVASQSRGAIVAAVGSLLVFAATGPRTLRGRAALAAAILVAGGVAVLVVTLQRPLPAGGAYARSGSLAAASLPRPRYLNAELYRRLQDDIGHPPFGKSGAVQRRTLFGSSGRAQAWDGAIHQGEERPVAGYGFGTEGRVFVDRYLSFEGWLPENSYIGLFLQLGLVGLAVFLALPLSVLALFFRALPRLEQERRALAAGCATVLVGGLLLAFGQSYIYVPGNLATAAVWFCAFLLLSLVPGRVTRLSRRASALVAAAAVVLLALIPVGRWEERRHARREVVGIERVLSRVRSLDDRSLAGYRILPGFDCLTYRRGADPFALELCVDSAGRLIEAIDRRGATPRIWTLREDPAASTVRVDRHAVSALLQRMQGQT